MLVCLQQTARKSPRSNQCKQKHGCVVGKTTFGMEITEPPPEGTAAPCPALGLAKGSNDGSLSSAERSSSSSSVEGSFAGSWATILSHCQLCGSKGVSFWSSFLAPQGSREPFSSRPLTSCSPTWSKKSQMWWMLKCGSVWCVFYAKGWCSTCTVARPATLFLLLAKMT